MFLNSGPYGISDLNRFRHCLTAPLKGGQNNVEKTMNEIERANELLQTLLKIVKQRNDIKFSNSDSITKDEYGAS